MIRPRFIPRVSTLLVLSTIAAGCDSNPSGGGGGGGGGGGNNGPRFTTPLQLPTLGLGPVDERVTSELTVRGTWAYTGTHKDARGPGNAIKVWNVAGPQPVLVDSVIIPIPPEPSGLRAHAHPGHEEGDEHEHAAGPDRIGDIQVSDDGALLVVATEGGAGSILVYSRANPAKPTLLSRFANTDTEPGVHTAEVARVNGRQYAFLSINPRASTSTPARLVIVDLADPANPSMVMSREMGRPYQHDVFVRDGILFTALWHDGVGIWDIGGGGRGGTVANPVLISRLEIAPGYVHNVLWLRDPQNGQKRWLFIGEERSTPDGFRGDVHVVDAADLANPKEVAFFRVEGAGAHNFSADESNGILYAAFFSGGVRALDVRGDLSECDAEDRVPDGRCDLGLTQREAARGLHTAAQTTGREVMVWGVEYQEGALYASDMRGGLWKLDASAVR
ncbi:MAG TPA: hypothetical protein VFS20_21925 [Longimicrobium sp.]|nr:hypothetical protein [Longimicrobium sp.]